MKTPSLLPIMIGITGHRDLRSEDLLELEKSVRGILSELQKKYSNTTLALLSPLAEGADRLAARVALDLGMRLFVPLPMPEEEYKKTFVLDGSSTEFDELLEKAEKGFELPALTGFDYEGQPSEMKYAAIGAYIARHSQILIALWDGVPTDKMGGTSRIVQFKLEGVPEGLTPPRSVLDPIESGPVYHVVTPRLSNPDPKGVPFTVQKLFPSSDEQRNKNTPSKHWLVKAYRFIIKIYSWFIAALSILGVGKNQQQKKLEKAYHRIYRRMDVFNRDDSRHESRLESERRKSESYLFPPALAETLSISERTIRKRYSFADSLAVFFQKLTLWTLRGLLLLALLAAISLNLYGIIDVKPELLVYLYLGFLLLAYGVLIWAYLGDYHNKYLDYRGLAEGMRVHFFWRLAGLRDSVVDHYLRKQRDELDWIRQAIRVWSIPTKLETVLIPSRPDAERTEHILNHWVTDQANFFTTAGQRDWIRDRVLGVLGYVFFVASLVLTVVKVFAGPVAPLVVPMTITLVIGAFFHYYSRTLALAEHVKQYDRMKIFYSHAEQHLESMINAGEIEKAQALIKEIGQEALTENGDWVLLHRKRPPSVPRITKV